MRRESKRMQGSNPVMWVGNEGSLGLSGAELVSLDVGKNLNKE